MKRFTLLYLLSVVLLLTLSAQPKHELRAVWLTTFGGLDWPHSYARSEAAAEIQRKELVGILDKLKAANVNVVLYQARIRGTVTYPSDIEPWDGCLSGNPGVGPGYDPLAFAIEECHKRGMQLHAWVVTVPVGKWDGYGAKQLRKKHPHLIKRLGVDATLNPEHHQTADYVASICEEIVNRYDVDGIHLDYIRYPDTWNITVSRQQGRTYITRIVEEINKRVKRRKPWVMLSCSPIGKHEDLTRYSSQGWNAYARVCQDAQGWLRDGLMDALFPMMYFDGKHFYPFAADWSENSYGKPISSGLGIYRLVRSEGNWSLDDIKRQLFVTRQLGLGHTYFRSKFLTDNVKGVYDLVCQHDAFPALVPPMTWAKQPSPTAPSHLTIVRTSEGDNLSWGGGIDNSNGDYITYNVYASAQQSVDINDPRNLIAVGLRAQQLSLKRKSSDSPLCYAVTAVNRYGMESDACTEQFISNTTYSHLLPCDGHKLTIPVDIQIPEAEYLAIYSMQGNIVTTKTFTVDVNVADVPEGCYELKTLNKKGETHRLGYFIIKRNPLLD